jgi:RNA polymerase sigma factor (sigma-70 family)
VEDRLAGHRFRELPEHELALLSDEQLLVYIQDARAVGCGDAVDLAVGILVHGHLPNIGRRVALKVPDEDVEDVARNVMVSALTSAFDGTSKGEFSNWVATITSREIANYWREKKRRLEPSSLPEDEDNVAWREALAVGFDEPPLDIERAIQIAYGELNPSHQLVVDLFVFARRPAAEVAALTGKSANNLSQIGRRFRERLRELLDEDDPART